MGLRNRKYKDESEMKGMYKDDYEDYETGDWLDIERELDKEYIPINEHDKWRHLSYMGQYRQLFEQIETKFKDDLTVFDYHNLYTCILERITNYIVLDNLWVLTCGEKLSITYEDIETAFANEKEKLDGIFKEFVLKVTKSEKVIKSKKKEKSELKTEHKDQPLSDLQKHLIFEKKLLYPDGERVIKNLSDVAGEVVSFTGKPVTSQYLLESFLRRNGSKYSPSTCNNARDYANTKESLKDLKQQKSNKKAI